MSDDLNAILRLEVPIIVQIGDCNLPLDHILSLAPGAIIELPKGADEQLDLMVNNKKIGSGVAVKVGENFGLRLARIEDVRERLEAMGPDGPDDEQMRGAAVPKRRAVDKAKTADVIAARPVQSAHRFEAGDGGDG